MLLYRSSLSNILVTLNKTEPLRIMITEGQKSVAVSEIYNDALKIAFHLQELGFETGDRVAIAAPPNGEFIKIFYALVFLKAVVAIIDPEMGRDNYQSKLRQFNPNWAFVDSRLLLLQEHPVLRYFYLKKFRTTPYFPYTPTAKMIACGAILPIFQKKKFLKRWLKASPPADIRWANNEPEISNGSDDLRAPDSGDEFLITYTSGTLAEPKGVVHTFASLFHSITLIGELLDRSTENLIATYLPHYMLIGFCVGTPSIMYKPALPAADRLAFFDTRGVTTIMGPPSDFISLIEYCETNKTLFPASLQHLLLGAAPVTRRFLKRLSEVIQPHTRITCLYGMTENLLVATIDGRFKKEYECEGDLLGKPAKDVTIKIVENEICIQSGQLFKGYFQLPARAPFHPSGDLGAFDKNNFLVLTGRKKDMIIRRHQNIYPAIYESTVNQMDGVTEAVFVGVYDDEQHDEKVYLIIEGDRLSKNDVFQLLKTGKYSIDQEALPDEILFMTLPRSGRQRKVDKTAIRDYIKQNQL